MAGCGKLGKNRLTPSPDSFTIFPRLASLNYLRASWGSAWNAGGA
jgi:hypothetical protein